MIASSHVAGRKINLYDWPRGENATVPKTRKQRVKHWFSPHWESRIPSLCHACRHRKLDLRPLTAKPPDIRELPRNPENEDLNELEERYAVYINGFSPEEARAVRLDCSLCALLLCCLDATEQDGWLGYMRCDCTLRPRFDRSTNAKKTGEIIHKQQIWVEFQPIEGEVLVDLVDIEEVKLTGKRRQPIPSTANPELIRVWFKGCDTKHKHLDMPDAVRSRMQTILDKNIFRVINTCTGLVEARTCLPEFAALSYVWGQDPGQAKNQPLQGGPIENYAPTIRDSLVLARSIGYEWLWVDRLCIDQASSDEKASLIPYMKDIYAAASLTIVAACGENAQSGLLGTQHTPRVAENPLIIGLSVAVLPICHELDHIISRAAWNERGWTFQEYVFSRRLLFVFKSEMFFTCGEDTFRESTGRRSTVNHRGAVNRWLFSEGGISEAAILQVKFRQNIGKTEDLLSVKGFLRAVREYSRRHLSLEEDRVAAFAGVVLAATSPMDIASEQAFLRHGHPLRFFEALLTWRETFSFWLSDSPNTTIKTTVPSWSWASTGRQLNIGLSGIQGGFNEYGWFHYIQLQNYDIMGLPTELNRMAYLAGLPLPEELVADRSWVGLLPHGLNPNDEGGEPTIAPALASIPPPTLHLLTLVFDARLVICDKYDQDKHILVAPRSNETGPDVQRRTRMRTDLMKKWSFRLELQDIFSPGGTRSRERPVETFAIVSGHPYSIMHNGILLSNEVYYRLHIILLEPTGKHNTYWRIGINDLDDVRRDSYLAETIREGRPRWQYIHLV